MSEDPPPASEKRARTASPSLLWPGSTGCALGLVPLSLLVLLLAYGIVRSRFDWPSNQYQGWVLLSILLLSLLPVFLLVVGLLARIGGTLEAPGGLRLSFAGASDQAATTVNSVHISENLGADLSTQGALNESSLQSITRALRTAHASDVTIIDIGEGKTWWESRLFILLAGAARRDRPRAIAFVGDRNGRSGVFLGWGAPGKLLEQHLKNSQLRNAHHRALSKTLQWELGDPVEANSSCVTLPWSDRNQLYLPRVAAQEPDPDFAFEAFLQEELNKPTYQGLRRHVNLCYLDVLYGTVLITEVIDRDAEDDAWAHLLVANTRQFFAVGRNGRLQNLVPRDALMSALLVPLVKQVKQPR